MQQFYEALVTLKGGHTKGEGEGEGNKSLNRVDILSIQE
jgi:hypothetical protein